MAAKWNPLVRAAPQVATVLAALSPSTARAALSALRAEREIGLWPPVRGLLLLTLRHARLAPFPGR
jgi:hypothetical protein